MARGYFCGGGVSGGVDCDDATALEAEPSLEGKTAGISGKDEIVSGKMPERGDWSSTELAAERVYNYPWRTSQWKGNGDYKKFRETNTGKS